MQEWEQLKEKGGKFYQAARWAKAIKCYSKAIALKPTAAVLYSNRALCHLQLSDFSRAREDAENAIRLDSKVVKYYRTLCRALQGLRLHRESSEACIAGINIDPSDEVLLAGLLEAQLNLAAEFRQKTNVENGGCPSQKPPDGCLKNGLSDLKGREKKFVQELENYFPQTGVSPGEHLINSSELSSTWADLKMRAEQGSKTAVKYLRANQLLSDAAFDAFCGKDVGWSLRRFCNAKKAWYDIPVPPRIRAKFNELAKEAFREDPKNADALHVVVLTEPLLVRADYERVIDMAKKCISLKPSVPEFYDALANLHAHTRDFKNAVYCYELALELEWNTEMLFHKARALMMLGCPKRRDAIKAFEQYVEASDKEEPCVPLACYYAAHISVNVGDDVKADEFWRKGQIFEALAIDLPYRERLKGEVYGHKDFVQKHLEKKALARGVPTPKRDTARHEYVVSGDELTCAACGIPGKNLSACGACRKTRYCGRACQQKDWPLHKISCKKT
jgi:tetratricopeptide (TPR) repeat protein